MGNCPQDKVVLQFFLTHLTASDQRTQPVMFVSATQLQLKSCLSVYSASQFSSRPASQFCYTDYFGSLQKSNCKKKKAQIIHKPLKAQRWKQRETTAVPQRWNAALHPVHFILCSWHFSKGLCFAPQLARGNEDNTKYTQCTLTWTVNKHNEQ